MILIINTADVKQVFIGIINKGKLVAKKNFQAQYQQAEKLLVEIDKLIKQSTIRNLKGIIVVSGPGPFTALRIGVITANTLAWALKIPVAGVKLTEFKNVDELVEISESKIKKVKKAPRLRSGQGNMVEPFYGKEPNITMKKK